MGMIYYVWCEKCAQFRNLDKFYALRDAKTLDELIKIADEIATQDRVRAALLVSFLGRHMSHTIRVFDEDSPEYGAIIVDERIVAEPDDDLWEEFNVISKDQGVR
jgi:hypothetical protein